MRSAAKKQSQQVPEPVIHEINPQFADRLPYILNEMSRVLVFIEPEIDKLRVQLGEFQDYLTYEIGKTRLAIAQEEWKDRADMKKLEADKAWLAKLVALQADFQVDVMTSSVTLIRSMVDRVQQTFGEMRVTDVSQS